MNTLVPILPLSLDAVVKRLSQAEKAEFFDTFWKVWAANGFATLGKKDTDLLIFGCLRKALGSRAPAKTYEWAHFLRLTPARVRTIQLESHLRFSHLLEDKQATPEMQMRQFFSKLQSIDLGDFSLKGNVDSVKVNFVVEDPVIQMEIDRKIKGVGGYINFLRNREVIVLRLGDFFRLVSFGEKVELVDSWVRQKSVESNDADGLRKRVSGHAFANMSGREQLSVFVDDLAIVAQVAPMINRLRTIVSGNTERKK